MRPKEYYDQNTIQEDPRYIFALIPPDFQEEYRKYIKTPIESIELEEGRMVCESLSELERGRDEMDIIWRSIQKASVIIANLTGQDTLVTFGLGVALMKKERVLVIADKSTKKKPNLPFNIEPLGIIYYDTENMENISQKMINQIEKLSTPEVPKIKDPRCKKLMNDVLKLRKEESFDTALLLFEAMDKIEPENWHIYKEWGITYKEMKDYDNAGKKLEKARSFARSNSNKSELYAELGVVYSENNLEQEALVAFEKAEDLDRDNADLYDKWATLYCKCEEESNEPPPLEESIQQGRFTKVDCPKLANKGEVIELSVQLTLEKPEKTAVNQDIDLYFPPNRDSVSLSIVVIAENTKVDQCFKRMKVPFNNDSEKVIFKLIPQKVGDKVIEVEFYLESFRIGYFQLQVKVEDSTKKRESKEKTTVITFEEANNAIKNAFMRSDTDEISQNQNTIIVNSNEDNTKLNFMMIKEGKIHGDWNTEIRGDNQEITNSLNKISSFITKMAETKFVKDNANRSRIVTMKGIGQRLFKLLIPEELSKMIKELKTGQTLCISTKEQWVPWEFLNDNKGFLGERFLIFRYPRLNKFHSTVKPHKSAPSKTKKILHVLGGDLSDAYIKKAKSAFHSYIKSNDLKTMEQIIFEELIIETKDADLLHFTCHGCHNNNELYLKISNTDEEGLNLDLNNLEYDGFKIKNGCIVFSNACCSTSTVSYFGKLINFGWAFYVKGAALFIGTLGTIPTSYAIEFANVFYQKLFSQSYSIAEAFWETKEEFRGKNNFFHVLYCLYGNPAYLSRKKS